MDILLYLAQGRFRSRGASETEATERVRSSDSDFSMTARNLANTQGVDNHGDIQTRSHRAVMPIYRHQHSRHLYELAATPESSSQNAPVNQNIVLNHDRGHIVGNQQYQSLHPADDQNPIISSQDNRCRSYSASEAGSYKRLSLRDQIARAVLDFSCPYRNTRAQQRQRLIAKAVLESLSPANPAAFLTFAIEDSSRPSKFDVILQMSALEEEQMQQFAWNSEDSSPNIYIKADDPLTFHRNPVPQSTDGIRGKVGFSRGFHVWKITWAVDQRGTHPFVGVATKEAPLHARGYCALVGSNDESFGWDILKKKCRHGNPKTKSWPYPDSAVIGATALLDIPDEIFCILDMDEGYLAFATDKKYLGIAFKGLKGKTLYPVVSAVWGHCEVTLRYFGNIQSTPHSLMDVCRRAIREQMRAEGMNSLNLPSKLKQYLHYA